MACSQILLPFPPSANNLFPSGRSGRRFASPEYKAWKTLAGLHLNSQPEHTHPGDVRVVYEFHHPDRRKRDLFNLEKALSDMLVAHGVIADDSRIVEGTVRWAADLVSGVRITIWDAVDG